jgi:hypothetical protein
MGTQNAKELMNQVDDEGHTPLDYAKDFGREDIAACMEEMTYLESYSLPLETAVKNNS